MREFWDAVLLAAAWVVFVWLICWAFVGAI